ncbi:MAG: hypothetical protein ACRDSF_27910 [Pseudonocardiaceae bacterium]
MFDRLARAVRVVTASRLHAVRYVQALRAYCRDKGYDIGVLVAFSGTVLPDTEKHTESSLNDFPESQTVERFATGEWHVLVVAEKYQTGFDQPLLYDLVTRQLREAEHGGEHRKLRSLPTDAW